MDELVRLMKAVSMRRPLLRLRFMLTLICVMCILAGSRTSKMIHLVARRDTSFHWRGILLYFIFFSFYFVLPSDFLNCNVVASPFLASSPTIFFSRHSLHRHRELSCRLRRCVAIITQQLYCKQDESSPKE